MKTLEQIMEGCPIAAAQRMFQDGQGVESNPYPYGTQRRKSFKKELERLQDREEYMDLMGCRI